MRFVPGIGWATFLLLSFFSLGVGMLIGAVGIGGVLLIPALIYFTGLGVHEAMATALASFIATGVTGTLAFQRKGTIDWNITVPVCAGAVVCGFLGAMVNSFVDARVLSMVLAVLIGFAGVYTLATIRGMDRAAFSDRPPLQLALLLAIGGFVGFGSGLTGAGGPLLSVPTMIMFGFPPLQTIGASQVVSILAASSGTIGHIAYGSIDFIVVGLVVLFEVVGVVLGVWIVHAINVAIVRRFVAWLCVFVGVWMIVKPF